MIIQILSFLHNLTTLLFGIYISAFFLGVKQNFKNILTLFFFSAFEGALYIIGFLLLGPIVINWLYALIIHLPLILFLTWYYKYPVVSSCISVFSAYLCCQLSNWVGSFALVLTDMEWCYYIARILTTFIVFFLLCNFVCHTTETIFAKDKPDLYIIGFLPCAYYIFDYTFTKLSDLLYSGNRAIIEFMGFAFCIAYFAFLFIYFQEYENKQEIKQYSDLMEMQLQSVQNEIEQTKNNKHKLAILRHDMRHHLDIILTQLQNNNPKSAIDYINEIRNEYNNTVITTYCQNEMINSVISIYQTRSVNKNITFNCNISMDGSLPCSDIAICTILSNALENAMHALEKMDMEKKWILLMLSKKQSHVLFQIENPILQVPKFIDGIPTSNEKGHGIGVKSIIYYVEQLNGQYHFSISNRTFVLKIII